MMKTTVEELRNYLRDMPGDFEVRVNLPFKVGKDFIDVTRGITDIKSMASRRMIMLTTEIIDLNPR